MPHNLPKQSNQHGFQLIEIVIACGVLLLLAHSFFTLILAAYQLLGLSRIQASARSLATNQMEIIRNLPFDDIGTIGGIPNGSIPQIQTVNSNGEEFTLQTSILYIDDSFDGVAPSDLLPTDYKRIKVKVTWTSTFPTQEMLELITDIAPKGPESEDGGGTIAIIVFDSLGNPVPQADVHLEAPTANPPIDLNLFTDNFGNLVIPGAPICVSCYSITVSKENFSTDRTYNTAEVTNPIKPSLTVIENQVSQVSFSIDQLSTANFISYGPASSGYPILSGIPFRLTSSKSIGTDDLGNTIYKLDQDYITDSSGNLSLELEWDTYTITLDNTTNTFAGSNPINPFALTPNTTQSIGFVTNPSEPHTLLTLVENASGASIASASVRLFDADINITQTTANNGSPDFGQTFFTPLDAGNYSIEVTHPDYPIATQSVTVNNQSHKIIILNP